MITFDRLQDAALGAGSGLVAAYRRTGADVPFGDPVPSRGAEMEVAAATATLLKPTAWEWFSSGSVENYAVSPEGWRSICSTPRPGAPDPPVDAAASPQA